MDIHVYRRYIPASFFISVINHRANDIMSSSSSPLSLALFYDRAIKIPGARIIFLRLAEVAAAAPSPRNFLARARRKTNGVEARRKNGLMENKNVHLHGISPHISAVLRRDERKR